MKANPSPKAPTANIVVAVPLATFHAAPETIGLANFLVFTESLEEQWRGGHSC